MCFLYIFSVLFIINSHKYFFTKTCNFFYINTYIYRYFFSYQFNPHIFHNSQLFPLISYLFFHFHSYPLLSSRFFRSQLQRKSGRSPPHPNHSPAPRHVTLLHTASTAHTPTAFSRPTPHVKKRPHQEPFFSHLLQYILQ